MGLKDIATIKNGNNENGYIMPEIYLTIRI
jgi:hypothetical protein